jgi:hypothetical protein
MHGHVKVTKIYDDHKEVVVDENNMIVQGMKVDVVSILTGEALSIPSIIPGYFQVGVQANVLPLTDASDIFYQLSAPLSAPSQYGEETSLELERLERSFVASTADPGPILTTAVYQELFLTSAAYVSATLTSATVPGGGGAQGGTGDWFVPIPQTNITKNYLDSVEIRIELDNQTANGIALKEFGLFSKNPASYKNNKPLLVAYKSLDQPITKRHEFSLLIEWSIGFLGNTNIYDSVTPGFK